MGRYGETAIYGTILAMLTTTAVSKLFTLLLENPRAVIESGIPIPCSLFSLLGIDDDENICSASRKLPVVNQETKSPPNPHY
jgi:hypothetical protein